QSSILKSSIAASVARPLSVTVYAPLSRLCAMNPRMANRLHRMGEDADRGMIYTGCGAEQNHSVLCAKFRCRLCHDPLPRPAFAEGRHRGSRCLVRGLACGRSHALYFVRSLLARQSGHSLASWALLLRLSSRHQEIKFELPQHVGSRLGCATVTLQSRPRSRSDALGGVFD